MYNTTNTKEKTEKLATTINQLTHIKMEKKKATQQHKDFTAMFKKIHKNHQANRIKYPDKMKTEHEKSHDVEIGYSECFSNSLMKAINRPVLDIPLNHDMHTNQEQSKNTVNH